MQLFGATHVALLITIVVIALVLPILARRRRRAVRLSVGWGLAANEVIWWWFRYSHEGFRFPENLPLQLCDVTIWATVIACLMLPPIAVEFAWFAGIAGASMALLTPDLWSPWPSYPAIYFFVAHGGIVIGACALVLGRMARLRTGAVWRAFGVLAGYAAIVGIFNAIFGTNYMYLCRKPASATVLDQLGPWPVYLAAGAAVALALFWLLWLPVRVSATAIDPR